MKLFLKKFLNFILIGGLPILFLLLLYVYNDPYKVLKSYGNYSYSPVVLNRDYVSTTVFLKNYKKHNYNSFILGSSRTMAYKPDSWLTHLSNKDIPYAFDAYGESIYGIYTKLKFLDSKNIKIKNALIILDRDASFYLSGNHTGHLGIKHPITSGESYLNFHLEFIKAYFNPKFLFSFYSYKILGAYKPFMAGYITSRIITYDINTNERKILDRETEILNNPKEYYLARSKLFYKREGEKNDTLQRINKEHKFMLMGIKNILDKNNTSYKVVISPLYEQIRFSYPDFYLLKNIFENNLYDFSGKNEFTDNKCNYYETSHYRPIVGDSILNLIYK